MNILKRVEITGLWGDKTLAVDLHRDVNFLIGVNGTGKTTVINLIAAALTADFQTLDRISFSRIEVHLAEIQGRKRPSIVVAKRARKNSPFPSIVYEVRQKASCKPVTYSLDDFQEQLLLREQAVYRDHTVAYRHHQLRRVSHTVTEHLRSMANVSWLSIQRFQPGRGQRDDRSYESSVDQKVSQLATDLVKYFSALAKKAETEASTFQHTVFLSLLHRKSAIELLTSVQSLDLDAERTALIEIFSKFRLKEQQFAASVDQHFKTLRDAIEQYKAKRSLTLEQWSALIGMWRSHSVVQEWHTLIERQRAIYEPRDNFLTILKHMIEKKRFSISQKNELESSIPAGPAIPLASLSSGEKQLLIILGEALLQEGAPWIYIADEPELSLHVKWQEQVISNLRRINPHAQIIFATHSPDIVSSYSSRIFDVEKVLR